MQAIQPLRHPVFAPLMALIAAIGMTSLVAVYVFKVLPKLGAVYRQTASGWERLPKLPEMPVGIRVSRRGEVWVSTLHGEGLNRLQASRWRTYSEGDFGNSISRLRYAFVLDGEDVWAVAD